METCSCADYNPERDCTEYEALKENSSPYELMLSTSSTSEDGKEELPSAS